MLRVILLLTGLIMAKPCLTQEWFPVGASWHYNQVVFFQGETYQYFEVSGEITIQGKTCKIIKGLCQCSFYEGENFLYEEEDRIYIYVSEADSFRVLYDFNLLPGDTITLMEMPELGGTGKFLIDSISILNIDTLSLRIQHISWIEGNLQYGIEIIEKIGSNGCLYPVFGNCDPGTGGLRCYEDSETGLINFQDPERPCDYISVATTEPKEAQSLNVYPNPASSTLNIESKLIIKEIELFNNLSKLSYQNLSVGNDHIEVNVGHLAPGFYFIKIIASDNSITIKPIIIQ